jgi:hypothetical protein
VEVSPFPYQGPLDPVDVAGRDDLVDDLVARVTEHRVTALLGPRRYGKTSVLGRVAHELADTTKVIAVDLYEVSSIADLAIRFDHALAETGRTTPILANLAAVAELNLGALRVELRRPPAARPDALATVHSQLELITGLAANTPTLLVIDEFSGIARVDGAAGLLRTHLQHRFASMGILFAGSEPSVMRMLFTGHAEPFYAQADLVEIGPLPAAVVVGVVQRGFDATGRAAGNVGSGIAAFTGGHPQRTMQLADAVWRRVDRGAAATDLELAEAIVDVRDAAGSGFERLFSSLPSRERDVLRVVASGGSPFGLDGALLGLGGGSAQHARDSLIDAGHVTVVGGSLRLVDPVFAEWLRHRLPI